MRAADAGSAYLAAIGITNQRETTVLWDRSTGEPVCNAIVWQDTRTADLCAALARDGGPDRLRAKTGLPLSTYFSGPKIRWMLDNVPGAARRAAAGELLFGTIDTWCAWNLTGGPRGGLHITDPTNASRTQLMDLATLDWDDELLRLMGVPRDVLPTIRPSSEVYGEATGTTATAADVTGVPVAGILGDQQAALFGHAGFHRGSLKNTYGTGCFVLLNTGAEQVASRHGLITTVAHRLAGQPASYCLEGSIATTGGLVGWLRDNLGIIGTSAEVETLAGSVPDNGGVYLVPAFSGLFAPHWRTDARGIMVGLTQHATRAHVARAALEATAWQTADVIEAMAADVGFEPQELRVDGGMVRDDLLMQIQADVLGVPVVRPRVTETTSRGAAYAAGLAVGYWSSLDELRGQWVAERRWEPMKDGTWRDAERRSWHRAIERSLDWAQESGKIDGSQLPGSKHGTA
jgi:glycerol kinase